MSTYSATKRVKYPPVGQCIYCYETSDLTMEHIIPKGLGGRYELYAASCRKCSDRTHAFEGRCLGRMYKNQRAHLNIRSEERGVPPIVTIQVRGPNGIEKQDVPLSMDPGVLYMPWFEHAKALSGAPDTGGKVKLWGLDMVPLHPDFLARVQAFKQKGLEPVLIPKDDAVVHDFMRMLAKIAHAYAVARVGIDTFVPGLASVIMPGSPFTERDTRRDIEMFLGSERNDQLGEPPSTELQTPHTGL
jgi:hypothetical protein